MSPRLSVALRLLALLLMIQSLVALPRLSARAMSTATKVSRAHAREFSVAQKSKSVLVAIADGTEEMEAVTIIDVLVRAGAKVTSASVMDRVKVIGSHGIKLEADCLIVSAATQNWDMIVCPGGLPGAKHLSESAELVELLRKQAAAGKPIAAICASPALVLARHGFLVDKTATCYPATKFTSAIDRFVAQKVVEDGNIVTSQGPATAVDFSLKLVDVLYGPDKTHEIRGDLLA